MGEKFSRLPWAIVFAEEYAQEIKSRIIQEMKNRVIEELADLMRPIGYVTRKIDKRNHMIRGTEVIFDRTGRGLLREVSIKSPTTEFSLYVNIDGIRIVDDTYTNLAEIAPDLEFLSAVPSDSYYTIAVVNLAFQYSAKVMVGVPSPVTFNRIFVLYDIPAR